MSLVHGGRQDITAERGRRDNGIGAALLEELDVFLRAVPMPLSRRPRPT